MRSESNQSVKNHGDDIAADLKAYATDTDTDTLLKIQATHVAGIGPRVWT